MEWSELNGRTIIDVESEIDCGALSNEGTAVKLVLASNANHTTDTVYIFTDDTEMLVSLKSEEEFTEMLSSDDDEEEEEEEEDFDDEDDSDE